MHSQRTIVTCTFSHGRQFLIPVLVLRIRTLQAATKTGTAKMPVCPSFQSMGHIHLRLTVLTNQTSVHFPALWMFITTVIGQPTAATLDSCGGGIMHQATWQLITLSLTLSL